MTPDDMLKSMISRQLRESTKRAEASKNLIVKRLKNWIAK